ncbi:MAG: chalcone isomerase family protein, partial [Bdellovibrionales bacterium]|nr:chalcone isomerase family protein [Bdellovibrionales bacterium]
MKIAAILLFMVLVSLPVVVLPQAAHASERCVDSFCFPDSVQQNGERLGLLGAAKKRYLIFNLYEAALYGPTNARSPDAILGPVPKRLVIKYLRTIEKKDFIEAARQVLENNPEVPMAAMEAGLRQINAAYRSVEKGDTYELAFDPKRGLTLILNGRE